MIAQFHQYLRGLTLLLILVFGAVVFVNIGFIGLFIYAVVLLTVFVVGVVTHDPLGDW